MSRKNGSINAMISKIQTAGIGQADENTPDGLIQDLNAELEYRKNCVDEKIKNAMRSQSKIKRKKKQKLKEHGKWL